MTEESGRVLGLDLGEVRIGIALSDPLLISAQPLETLRRVGPRKDLAQIVRLAGQHEVRTVVVGLPLHLSGEESSGSAQAREFAESLRRRLPGTTVTLWDERLTTAQAEREMISASVRRDRRKRVVDALAAVLILQSFLDSRPCAPGGSRS